MKHIREFAQFGKKEVKDLHDMGLKADSKLKDVKAKFRQRYSYVSLDLSDEELEDYLMQPYVLKEPSIDKKADLLYDYILSQGLGDVQESEHYDREKGYSYNYVLMRTADAPKYIKDIVRGLKPYEDTNDGGKIIKKVQIPEQLYAYMFNSQF